MKGNVFCKLMDALPLISHCQNRKTEVQNNIKQLLLAGYKQFHFLSAIKRRFQVEVFSLQAYL